MMLPTGLIVYFCTVICVLSAVLLKESDDGHRSDRSMLVRNNMWLNMFLNVGWRERETNKMQLIWYLLSNFYLNMFRASLCPSSCWD